MNSSDLTLAGYVSIFSGVLAVPFLLLTSYANLSGLDFLYISVQIVGLLVYFYTTNALINLLDDHDFPDVNGLLWATVYINILAVFLSVFMNPADEIYWLAIIPVVILGLIMVVIGVKLQRCKFKLHGYLNLFAYSWIGTGVMMASVLLIPVAIFATMILYILQGMIFLKESEMRRSF